MDYKLVLLDNIWENNTDSVLKEYFPSLIQIKKLGYGSRHDNGYIPFGAEDMFAAHLMICRLTGGQYIPLLTAKVVSLVDCLYYGVRFPLTGQMEGYVDKSFVEMVDAKIMNSLNSGDVSTYGGGFTIHREHINSKEELALLKDIYTGVNALYHLHNDIRFLYGFGSFVFKTIEYLKSWGAKHVYNSGEIVNVVCRGANLKPVTPLLLDFEDMSAYAKDMMTKYLPVWEDRVEAGGVAKIKAA